MRSEILVVAVSSFLGLVQAGYTDIPCQWKSRTGSTFDLRPLTTKEGTGMCYGIKDGDIPCTPEHEPTYSYVWNFCADITTQCYPKECKNSQSGAVLQYLHRQSDGYEECNVIGHYDPARDDTYYRLLEDRDPSKGVSITYIYGDKCPSGKLRSATIDVVCANTKLAIESALEPAKCDYHMVMKSYHGCPLECPVSSAGLCSSHGHCSYDPVDKAPRCYCNQGYGGSDCGSKTSSTSTSYNGLSVQIGLMVTLLLVALGLIGVIGFLSYRIGTFRKSQQYSQLPMSGTEMVERPF